MDLLFIIGGMGAGSLAGWIAAAILFPGGGYELEGIGAIVGGIAGVLTGYMVAWQIKQAQVESKRPKPLRLAREFPRQVVGSDCAKCGQRMMVITDGQVCPACGRVFCRTCEPELPCSDCRARSEAPSPG